MTNDTAPELIWAWRYTGEQNKGQWFTANLGYAEAEYIRADLAARQQAEAVGAAYEAAANSIKRSSENARKRLGEAFSLGAGREITQSWSAVISHLDLAHDAIRALTPSDATAALEARDARVWDAAIEATLPEVKRLERILGEILGKLDEALEPPEGHISMHAQGQTPDWFVEAAEAASYSADRIRALKKGSDNG